MKNTIGGVGGLIRYCRCGKGDFIGEVKSGRDTDKDPDSGKSTQGRPGVVGGLGWCPV